MDKAIGPCTQRLWLLERIDDDAAGAWRNVCRFAGAVAVLTSNGIHVLILRSPDMRGASATPLARPGGRWDCERNGMRFSTLDAALAWADEMKLDWLGRDWLEVESDDGVASIPA